MIISGLLIAFFLLFFFVRKHSGASHLAAIAGFAVYELLGVELAGILNGIFSGVPVSTFANWIFISLVLIFPLILYFRSGRGGLSGIWRALSSIVFAVLIVSLISPVISQMIPLDDFSNQVAHFVYGVEKYVIVAGIIFAYIDILVNPSSKND